VFLIFATVSILLCLMWVWKPFNTQFNIEETLAERLNDEEGTEEEVIIEDDLN